MRGLAVVVVGTLVLMASGASVAGREAAISIGVDERVELISIIFHLAGNPEYNQTRVEAYARDVARHFAAHREHEVVRMARRLREQRGVSFDAPMSLAPHLKDAKALELVVPLEPWPVGIDARWRADELEAFLAAARRFVEESEFEHFMEEHRAVYAQACERISAMLKSHARLGWFDEFFGERAGASFHLVVGLLNGTSNYGVRVVDGGGEQLYCILGAWNTNAAGEAVFPRSVLPTVIHEFCHSYANPLVDAHLGELSEAGEVLYQSRREQMNSQAYSSGPTVLRESLVRACVVRYRFAQEGPAAALLEVFEQRVRGFDWVLELSQALEQYERQREAHPTLESYMPQIVEVLRRRAEQGKQGDDR